MTSLTLNLTMTMESYRHLGFYSHARKNIAYGVSHLVSAARILLFEKQFMP